MKWTTDEEARLAAYFAARARAAPLVPEEESESDEEEEEWPEEGEEGDAYLEGAEPASQTEELRFLFPGRTPESCRDKRRRMLRKDRLRACPSRAWSEEEDMRLRTLMSRPVPSAWSWVAERLGTRGPDACQKRWERLHLDAAPAPAATGWGPWSEEERARLVALVGEHGPAWQVCASRFPGRSIPAIRAEWRRMQDGEGGEEGEEARPPLPWSEREEAEMMRAIEKHGSKAARYLFLPGRNRKNVARRVRRRLGAQPPSSSSSSSGDPSPPKKERPRAPPAAAPPAEHDYELEDRLLALLTAFSEFAL